MSTAKAKLNRRNFLLAVGAGSAASAAALIANTTPQTTPVSPGDANKNTRGYQVTEHVRNYYRTTLV